MNDLVKIIVFPSDKPAPVVEKPAKNTVYLWFEHGKMYILQNGIWFVTPYYAA